MISPVHEFKEPKEKFLTIACAIAQVNRVIFGHTHSARHELIGPVEHLNSGTWSPAFLDVECTIAHDEKTFIWIEPAENSDVRKAQVLQFVNGEERKAFVKNN